VSEDRSGVVGEKERAWEWYKEQWYGSRQLCTARPLRNYGKSVHNIHINARSSPSDRQSSQPALRCSAKQPTTGVRSSPSLSLSPKNIEPLSNLSSQRRKNKWSPCRANNVRAQYPLLPAVFSFATAHRSWYSRFRCL